MEEVKSFFYFGDVLDCSDGAERTVRNTIACAWSKWKELSNVLTKGAISLRIKPRYMKPVSGQPCFMDRRPGFLLRKLRKLSYGVTTESFDTWQVDHFKIELLVRKY